MSDEIQCGNINNEVDLFGVRVASVFVILATSMFGAFFPVLTRKSKFIHIPEAVFQFAKYFGSGVIIATAFIHLLSPATQELTAPCLGQDWQNYPYALGISMASVFAIFFAELFAFRWGTAKLAEIGKKPYDAHGHGLVGHSAHGPEAPPMETKAVDEESLTPSSEAESPLDSGIAQIIGIAILEFGVLFHSVIIGLTLAVDPQFKILFIVIIFHQMFEGLGLGSRLAYLDLPKEYRWAPYVGAALYGCTTPIGIAAGLGVRTTYNPNSTTASIVSGVLDSISSGILLYTGLVELLAHEFLFNPAMSKMSNKKLFFATAAMLFGAGIMALLGRWA
ncbi:hypothetical protein Clacol_005392 [Clathrus columnatus]|uniref:ZIP zinc/iron transport family n=1 Tax=Clathrus columnatus TaxID=1419009 RepID=A0AAV5A9Z1_9AGAM|nr:hypothetical protein Clacol_005392 [Clathrus columnatus]